MRVSFGLLLLTMGALAAPPVEMERARQLYSRTQYTQVLQVLKPAADLPNGPVQELIGKSYFMLAEYKKAAEVFERAIAVEPGNAVYHHWLGKSWGRRAETSNPLLAPSYATRARNSFEKAVQLDPKNLEATNDLFSYYLEAPGFLGGGLDKAAMLARKIQAVDPIEGHYALAQIAESRKEWSVAERHFRSAMELAPNQVGRVIDLARFLSKQGRDQESEVLFVKAEKIAPEAPRVLFERANAYIRAKKNLPTAKTLLEKYLKMPLSPDDPSRSEAERLLKQTQSMGA